MLSKENVQLGIAPIAWTNDDLPELGGHITFEQCVSEMALAGFTGSEVGTKYPKDTRQLKKALELRGLQICNAWFSAFFLTKPMADNIKAFEEHCDFLAAMGAAVCGLAEQGNSIQGRPKTALFKNKPDFTEAEWSLVARGLEELGRVGKRKGISVGYHHHMGTGVQSLAEIDHLMAITDPELVKLTYDTGHCTFAGEDAVAVLSKYIKRVNHVHLKDVRQAVLKRVQAEELSFLQAVKEGIFTIPGEGTVDYKAIFKLLADHDYKGWIVVEAEQDPARANPLEYALRARKFIAEHTGL